MNTLRSPALAILIACSTLCIVGNLRGPAAPARADDTAINPEVQRRASEHRPPNSSKARPIQRVDVDLDTGTVDERINRLLSVLTLEEKIGQLCQISVGGENLPDDVANDIRFGRVGSLFYTGSRDLIAEAQRIAMHEARVGLPLLAPRDVIHGFRTVFPIPLGQAASWDPALIERAAQVSAVEARAEGVNWTFGPMLDISRDARWGRIAESPGEDPLLASRIATAMVRGYQADTSSSRGIAACAKHYVGYGASEGGRDYNRVQVSVSELHNVYLAPFRAANDAGCLTVMSGFHTVNGIPATGHRKLIRGTLKNAWRFPGLVVSDWSSVVELIEHGYARNERHAARLAFTAGVDMEMATSTYRDHLADLVREGRVSMEELDDAVARILRVKMAVAVPVGSPQDGHPVIANSEFPSDHAREIAQKLATESIVLLKNDGVLPVDVAAMSKIAVIGPLADAARDQMGCWMLDGRPDDTVTALEALRDELGDDVELIEAAIAEPPTDASDESIAEAITAAKSADVAIVFVGESWWMSGEARSRADLSLPGAQTELIRQVTATGTPTVVVVLAGRPSTIGTECEVANAVLFGWHPGTMGGPAIAELLLGRQSPSGKLPVTFPKHVGQSPLYYNHPDTGRPALPGTTALIGSGRRDFPEVQKYRSHYIDCDPFPLYPFGYGLSYTRFEYGAVELSRATVKPGQSLSVRTTLTNTGDRTGEEVAQLYLCDVTGSLVRPVRQLADFRRVALDPGETVALEFQLTTDQLAYFDNRGRRILEPGEFKVGVGGDSQAALAATFRLTGERQILKPRPDQLAADGKATTSGEGLP